LLPRRPRLPGLRAIAGWRSTGRGDVIAGFAVAAYLIPQCLAYAQLAGVEPVRGLWTALPALAIYAIAGSSRLLSVGPESASALLVGSAVAALSARGDLDPADAAGALALAVAGVAFVAWLARLGFLADLLSKPVLIGYLAGVAVTMTISQLPNLTGIDTARTAALPRLADVVRSLGDARAGPLLLGGMVVVILLTLQRWTKLPGPLLVIVAATVATSAFDLERHGVATLGHVPVGLPPLTIPSVPAYLWPAVFGTAIGVAMVAFSGNVLTARAFTRGRDDRVDADQELFALAAANVAVGLGGGFPVSSSESRTALADAAGSRSQLTSLAAAACVALVLGVAAPLLEAIPLAALAGLVVYAGGRLVALGQARRVISFRRSEGVIMVTAFAGVVGFGLLVGVGVAVALSVGDLLRRVARAHDAIQGTVPGLAGMHDIDDYPSATTIPGLIVYRYDAPLFFANAEDVRARVLAAVNESASPVEWIILNMEANVEIDLTAADMLEDLQEELEARGIVLGMARVKHDLAIYLDRVGLLDRIGRDHVFPTLPTAVEGFHGQRRQ
jgi:high affinity sulfate transporter 1